MGERDRAVGECVLVVGCSLATSSASEFSVTRTCVHREGSRRVRVRFVAHDWSESRKR